MAIKLTGKEFTIEQFEGATREELQWDLSDERDVTFKFDAQISQGWQRKVELRKGLFLFIDHHRPSDKLEIQSPERAVRNIHCIFVLSGKRESFNISTLNKTQTSLSAGKYILRGNGTRAGIINHLCSDRHSLLEFEVRPEILRSFAASLEGELPQELRHLIKLPGEAAYDWHGDIQPSMTTVIQQIYHCPHKGMVKRMYLESKTVELMALVLEHEIAIQKGMIKKSSLKPEQLERIYYAREILLRDLGNPPTLEDLAHQVGLNDFLLKRGFHQAFGTTVFEALQSHRMEIAKQLLAEGKTKVSDIGLLVGYASISAFTRAFKRKFKVSPKAYQKKWAGK